MLYNATNYWRLIKRDIKIWDLVLSIIYIIALLAFPIFLLAIKLGNLYVNIVMISVSVIYSIITIVLSIKNDFRSKPILIGANVVLALVTLSINVYSLYLVILNSNGVGIALASLMTILWIIKVLFSLIYNILLSRAEIFGNIILEDIKPLVNKNESLNSDEDGKTIIDINEVHTPKHVEKAIEKSTNYSANVSANIKAERLNKIMNEVDTNNDGDVNILELITAGLNHEKTYIEKEKFLVNFLRDNKVKQRKINKYIAHGPKAAGFSLEEVDHYVHKIIKGNKKAIKIVKDFLNEGIFNFEDEKEFNKLLKAFSSLLIIMQKIMYLNGFAQINDNKHLSDVEITALALSLHIILDDEFSYKSQKDLYKANNIEFTQKVKNFALDKFEFIKAHKDQIFDFVKDNKELVDGLVELIPSDTVKLIVKGLEQVVINSIDEDESEYM